jgi:sulfur carrier protein ThiS
MKGRKGKQGPVEPRDGRRSKDTVMVTVSAAESTSYLLPGLPLEQEVELPKGSNWWHLRDILGLREVQVIWTVNGRIAKEEVSLPDGARVEITPFLDGG